MVISNSDEIDNYLSLAKNTNSEYDLYEQLKPLLLDIYHGDIQNFDIFGWSQELYLLESSLCEKLEINKSLSGETIKDVILLEESLNDVILLLNQIEGAFSSINSLLDTKLSPSLHSLDLIKKLLLILRDNQPLTKELFLGNSDSMEELITLGESNSKEIELKCSEISKDWEESIFELDYIPLLDRFKLDYSSEFIEIKEKYLSDYSKLKSIFKGDSSLFSVKHIKKVLSDVLDLLDSKTMRDENSIIYEKSLKFVKLFKEKETTQINLKDEILDNWEDSVLLDKHKELLERFATDYDSPTKLLNRNYHADKKLIQSFYEYKDKVTPNIVEELLEQLEKYEDLNKWVLTNQTTNKKSNEIIKNHKEINTKISYMEETIQKNWDLGYLSTNYAKYSRRYNQLYNSEFNNTYTNFMNDTKVLKKYHKEFQKKITYDIAVDILKQLSEYKNKENWFHDNKSKFQENFGLSFREQHTNWAALLSNLKKVTAIKELMHYEVSPTFISLLAKDYKPLIFELETNARQIGDLFDKIDSILNNQNIHLNKEVLALSLEDEKEKIIESYNICEEIIKKLEELSPYYTNTTKTLTHTLNSFDDLIKFSVVVNKLAEKEDQLALNFQDFYQKSSTSWSEIINLLELVKDFNDSSVCSLITPLLQLDFDRKKEILDLVSQMKKNHNFSIDGQKWLFSNFSEDYNLSKYSLPKLNETLKGCFEQIDSLLPWIDYQEAKHHCKNLNLEEFIEIVEHTENFHDIDKIFLREFYKKWLDILGGQFDEVRKFRRNNHDSNVAKFIDLDKLQLTIAQSRIREKLIGKLPTEQQKLSKASDELSILRRELDKKRKLLPLRALFRSIPNLLLRLKPCLMMSPLSVATLLETEAYEFDLLIFDEASQIFPEDAIGSLLRANQVIVAGDSKQLPPSNFFSSSTSKNANDDFDSEEEFDELIADSILEESVKILHNRTLRWHYRSKYESLITFSNREIYKNNLITFPSKEITETDVGLEFVYVEAGYYEGGGKSCNSKEAEMCTTLVRNHIMNQPNRTLGIIAFSQKQQAEIESKFHKFRENNPQFEYFFDENKNEPFFVKNLENVQGDERDTILFSIGYAKEQGKDKMAMRFGPLGQSGGERRLNVAITRAKYNIKLVASILPTDIDLNRTKAEGVKLLRSYIEFARLQTSSEGIIELENLKNNEDSDEFVDSISNFLIKKGYTTEKYVGTSDYKIDIAVENPREKGEFSVAIECDGLCYSGATTARDRDHLRGSMLNAMGWRKYRIWSTEWIRNTDKEEKSLLEFIENTYSEVNIIKVEEKHPLVDSSFEALTMNDFLEEIDTDTEVKDGKNFFGFKYYQSFQGFTAQDFCDMYDYKKIGENLIKILSVESPLPKDTVFKKVLPTLKADKLTVKIKNTLNMVISNVVVGQIIVDEDEFLWLLPKCEPEVRIPSAETPERTFDQISTLEISKAMVVLAEYLYGPTIGNLTAEVGRVYGFERSSKKIKEKAEVALKLLLNQNKVKILDDKVIVQK